MVILKAALKVLVYVLRILLNILLKCAVLFVIAVLFGIAFNATLAKVLSVSAPNLLDMFKGMELLEGTLESLQLEEMFPTLGAYASNIYDLIKHSNLENLESPLLVLEDAVGVFTLAACIKVVGVIHKKLIEKGVNTVTQIRSKVLDIVATIPTVLTAFYIASVFDDVVMVAFDRLYQIAPEGFLKSAAPALLLAAMMLLFVCIVWLFGRKRGWLKTFINTLTELVLGAIAGAALIMIAISVGTMLEGITTAMDIVILIGSTLLMAYAVRCQSVSSLNPFTRK